MDQLYQYANVPDDEENVVIVQDMNRFSTANAIRHLKSIGIVVTGIVTLSQIVWSVYTLIAQGFHFLLL